MGKVFLLSKHKTLCSLFYILTIWELLLLLFPVWYGSPIWMYITVGQYFEYLNITSVFPFLFISFLYFIIKMKISNSCLIIPIVLLTLSFLLSIVMTGFKSGFVAIWGIPLSFTYMYCEMKKYAISNRLLHFIFYFLFFWSFLPLLYIIVAPFSSVVTFFTSVNGSLDTFSGFALHRNFYGMIVGCVFLLLPFVKIRPTFKFIILVSLLIGIYLAACRSVIVAIIIAGGYWLLINNGINKRKRILLIIVSIIVVFVGNFVYEKYTIREVNDNDDRKELYHGFYNKIKEKPLWGYGKEVRYYSIRRQFQEGTPAHNFILQVAANNGLIVLFFFMVFLLIFFLKSGRYTRVFLIYVMVWGLFQPYFSLGIPSPQIYIPLICGYFLDNNYENNLLH